jgi:RNA polymerase sigma factor (sigma-70 family)
MRTLPQARSTDVTLAATSGEYDKADRAREPRERLQKWVLIYGPAVARVAALYERNAADRQDLAQQIWLAAWRAWPDFRGECSDRTFLLRIAHNRAVTALVRRRSANVGLEEAAEIADPAPGPERQAASEQESEKLLTGLQHLNVLQRQVLSLALEGIPQAEIAEILGVTANNVAVTLHRARTRLRAWLEETE